MQDRKRQDMQDNNLNDEYELTGTIIGCCFNVMNDLGSGFLEAVYKNALYLNLKEKGLNIVVEKRFEILYRSQKIGIYKADLVVEDKVIVELKCCEKLHPEHKAQLINYLKASQIPLGLLVNFGNRKLEYKRLYHPDGRMLV